MTPKYGPDHNFVVMIILSLQPTCPAVQSQNIIRLKENVVKIIEIDEA